MIDEIKIGDRIYPLVSPPLSVGRKFRQRIKEIATPILPELTALVAGVSNLINVDMSDQATIAKIALEFGPLMIDGPDLIIDLGIDYWSPVAADREYVLEHATMPDVVRLFSKAVADAYPFGQMVTMLPISTNGAPVLPGAGM